MEMLGGNYSSSEGQYCYFLKNNSLSVKCCTVNIVYEKSYESKHLNDIIY